MKKDYSPQVYLLLIIFSLPILKYYQMNELNAGMGITLHPMVSFVSIVFIVVLWRVYMWAESVLFPSRNMGDEVLLDIDDFKNTI